MLLLEYQAKRILSGYGLQVPSGTVIIRVEDIKSLNGFENKEFMLKAQVFSGKRFGAGGIRSFKDMENAGKFITGLLGCKLVTPQTGPCGALVHAVLAEEKVDLTREIYVSISFDRDTASNIIILGKEGGVNVENCFDNNLSGFMKQSIQPDLSFTKNNMKKAADFLEIDIPVREKLLNFLEILIRIYKEKDCILLEINPLGITSEGDLIILDCKMEIDRNSVYRQKNLASELFRYMDPLEASADKAGMDFVRLEGNIGCLANGAGMAMATLDFINKMGGRAANFLDVRGAVSPEAVDQAFEFVLAGKGVKGMLVNIFGGIVDCGLIAQGLLNALHRGKLIIPAAARFHGTGSKEAKEGLIGCGPQIKVFDELEKAVIWINARIGSEG